MEGLTCPATSHLEAGGGTESRQNPGPGAQSRPSGNPPTGSAQTPALAPCLWAAIQNHKGLWGFYPTLTCSPPAASPGGLPWEYRPWGSQRRPWPGTLETGLPLPLTGCFSPGFSGPPADSRCPVV